jgi:hypothetical protein
MRIYGLVESVDEVGAEPGNSQRCPEAHGLKRIDPDILDPRVGERTISYRRRSDPDFRRVLATPAAMSAALLKFDGCHSIVGTMIDLDEDKAELRPVVHKYGEDQRLHRIRDNRYKPNRKLATARRKARRQG